jgi:hypothetical protein
MHPALETYIASQDGLITRQQALAFMTDGEINSQLGKTWQVVLPGIYALFTGSLSDRHLSRAALLRAGDKAMLNDASALLAHKIPYVPADPLRRILVPDEVQVGSRDFVVIRRTKRLPPPHMIAGFPVAPIVRALCEFAARHPNERDSLAVVAAAVQQRRVALTAIHSEILAGPSRGRQRLLRIEKSLAAGVRSAPEDDFRRLALTSSIVPEPEWNALIELPSGERISPDAMIAEAALIHETNGREFHSAEKAGEDAFEDMQRRADVLVVAGFTVLQNTPRRIAKEGPTVLGEFESCYLRNQGRGLPPGVKIIRRGRQ